MNLKFFFLTPVLILLLYSCAEYNAGKPTSKKIKHYYSSSGFALIYEDSLYNDKVVNKKIKHRNKTIFSKTRK